MSKLLLKYFGEIDLANLVDCYDSEIEFKDRKVKIDLNIIPANNFDIENIKILQNFLDDLTSLEQIIVQAIKQDYENKLVTKEYIDFHIEELDKSDIDTLIKNADKKLKRKERLLSVMYLKRIGFYPEKGEDTFAIFDYALNEELTDELLVIGVSKDKDINWITWES